MAVESARGETRLLQINLVHGSLPSTLGSVRPAIRSSWGAVKRSVGGRSDGAKPCRTEGLASSPGAIQRTQDPEPWALGDVKVS